VPGRVLCLFAHLRKLTAIMANISDLMRSSIMAKRPDESVTR
jgi:hypothetical protein